MKNLNKESRSSKRGFTMVEVVLVVAVVGTLGAIAIPHLLDLRQEAKETQVAAIETSVASAIRLQAKNAFLRCGKAVGDYPSIESLRANDMTVGGDCAVSSISDFDKRFVTTDIKYPPTNVINGLDTIGLAEDASPSTFESGKCSADANSEEYGWCYNPENGDFFASTNTVVYASALVVDPCEGIDPGYCYSSSSSVVSSSSSSSSVVSSSSSSSSVVSSSSSSSSVVSSSSSSSSVVSSSSSSSSVVSSSSSSSSVVSSSSSSSVGGGDTGGTTGGGTGGESSSSSSSESSSSSSSSSVESSSSSSSSSVVSSSSSSVAATLYATCDEVPAEQRITFASIVSGQNSIPAGAIYTQGSSQKVCSCKPQGSGFNQHSPSLNGVLNGVGHASSYFILGSSCY